MTCNLRKQRSRAWTKPKLPAISRHSQGMAAMRQVASVVGHVGPSRLGTGVSQGRLTRPGLPAQKHADSLSLTKCRMHTGGVSIRYLRKHWAIQKDVTAIAM